MEKNNIRLTLGKPEIEKLKALGGGLRVGQVLGPRVLVKVVEPFTIMDEVEKKGLLFIPDTVKDKNKPMPSTGIVLQVGSEVPEVLTPGVMVMFSKFAGTDFTVDQEEGFRILEVKEILCTLEDTQEVVKPVKGSYGPERFEGEDDDD